MWNPFKRSVKPTASFDSLVVDVHSHFLPGIDDGAQNMEESMTMLSAMLELGYSQVITTPHILQELYPNTPEIILEKLDLVRAEIKKRGMNIKIDAAAEYYIDEDFINRIPEIVLSFGSRYVLVETSMYDKPQCFESVIFELQMRKYKVVLAHPERYSWLMNDMGLVDDFVLRGLLYQLNINSLSGYYSPAVQKFARALIDKGVYSFVGSDAHKIDHIRLMKNSIQTPEIQKLLNSGAILNETLADV